MKPEDIQQVLEKALDPINKKLEALEKGQDANIDQTGEQELSDEEKLAKQLEDVVAAAVDPIAKRLEAIEKTRAGSQQQSTDDQQSQAQPVEKSYMQHFYR